MPQRTPRNDPTLLNGDSAHGNLGEPAGGEQVVDCDTGTGSLAGTNELRQEETETLDDEFERGEESREAESRAVERQEATDRLTGGELPIRDYQWLTVPEVIRQAVELPPTQLAEVLSYESSHRNRKTLVARLRRLAERT